MKWLDSSWSGDPFLGGVKCVVNSKWFWKKFIFPPVGRNRGFRIRWMIHRWGSRAWPCDCPADETKRRADVHYFFRPGCCILPHRFLTDPIKIQRQLIISNRQSNHFAPYCVCLCVCLVSVDWIEWNGGAVVSKSLTWMSVTRLWMWAKLAVELELMLAKIIRSS